MQTLLFSVANPDIVSDTLRRIRGLIHPKWVGPLYPDAKSPELERDWMVAIDDTADIAAAAKTLRTVPGVEAVEAPAVRGLID